MLIQKPPLYKYQWEKRPILLFSHTPDNPKLKAQLSRLFEVQKALHERHIEVLVVLPEQVLANNKKLDKTLNPKAIKAYYHISEDFEGLLLIGKDQGEKMRAALDTSPSDIFRLIDSMPMRRQEMKRK